MRNPSSRQSGTVSPLRHFSGGRVHVVVAGGTWASGVLLAPPPFPPPAPGWPPVPGRAEADGAVLLAEAGAELPAAGLPGPPPGADEVGADFAPAGLVVTVGATVTGLGCCSTTVTGSGPEVTRPITTTPRTAITAKAPKNTCCGIRDSRDTPTP